MKPYFKNIEEATKDELEVFYKNYIETQCKSHVEQAICKHCGKTLPAHYFNINKRAANGLHSWCRDCQLENYSYKHKPQQLAIEEISVSQSVSKYTESIPKVSWQTMSRDIKDIKSMLSAMFEKKD